MWDDEVDRTTPEALSAYRSRTARALHSVVTAMAQTAFEVHEREVMESGRSALAPHAYAYLHAFRARQHRRAASERARTRSVAAQRLQEKRDAVTAVQTARKPRVPKQTRLLAPHQVAALFVDDRKARDELGDGESTALLGADGAKADPLPGAAPTDGGHHRRTSTVLRVASTASEAATEPRHDMPARSTRDAVRLHRPRSLLCSGGLTFVELC